MRTLTTASFGLLSILWLGLATLIGGCKATAPTRIPAETNQAFSEEIPPSEAEAIQRLNAMLDRSYDRRSKPRPTLRAAHAKSTGCAAGTFKVNDSIPAAMRAGIFETPPPQGYPIWLRFSNGNGEVVKKDSLKDSRGIAFKLLGVEGPKLLADDGITEQHTQDFFLHSAPNFMTKDAIGFVKYFEINMRRTPLQLGEFVKEMGRMPGQSRDEIQIGTETVGKDISDPTRFIYWSGLPSLIGNTAVKYRIVPVDCQTQVELGGLGAKPDRATAKRDNFLSEALSRALATSPRCFSFQAQAFKDEQSTPIEDAMVVWKTPFTKLALIRLENFSPEDRSAADPAEHGDGCEKLAFNPWHGLVKHRPLGGLYRMRKLVYLHSERIRRRMNAWAPVKEPVPFDSARPSRAYAE